MPNKETLKNLQASIEELTSENLQYHFINAYLQQNLQLYDKALMSLSKDPTITKIVNKTKFPDDVIILLLQSQGIDINNIYDLDLVEMDEIKGKDTIGYNIKISLPIRIEKVSIDITISDYNKKEDDNRCE